MFQKDFWYCEILSSVVMILGNICQKGFHEGICVKTFVKWYSYFRTKSIKNFAYSWDLCYPRYIQRSFSRMKLIPTHKKKVRCCVGYKQEGKSCIPGEFANLGSYEDQYFYLLEISQKDF